MPGGVFDSSKTRVAPVFEALAASNRNWVHDLLVLAEASPNRFSGSGLDLRFQSGAWGERETPIPPPVSLLSWLIRNPAKLRATEAEDSNRNLLLHGNPTAVAKALDLLRTDGASRAWYILEGPTVPDALIETPDALVVIEGKRTEAGPTTDTTWLSGRHQIWRHIDAAWERKGRRKVFGMFIVEGEPRTGAVPRHWRKAIEDALSPAVIETSFPHRGPKERSSIKSSLLGVTTWQHVVQTFGLPNSTLIERLGEAKI